MWRVKNHRSPDKKWYQYSSEPFYQKQCYKCFELIVLEYNEYWYYRIAFPLCIIPYFLLSFTTGDLSVFLKIVTLILASVGFYFLHRQFFDFNYISIDQQRINKVKNYIAYAGRYFDNPIETSEYCKKYSLNIEDLNSQISSGLVEAFAFEGIDFINDIAPNNKT